MGNGTTLSQHEPGRESAGKEISEDPEYWRSRSELNTILHACSMGLISGQHHCREQAIELHGELWQIWALVRAAVGLRTLIAGLPAPCQNNPTLAEAWLLANVERAYRDNPHMAVLHRLHDDIRRAQGKARNLLARVKW